MDDNQDEREENLGAEDQALSRLWSYALTVLYPAATLRQAGLYRARHIGARPAAIERSGMGRYFSRREPFPVLHKGQPAEAGYDEERHERLFEPLRALLSKELLREAGPFLRPGARALEPRCGAGAEAIELAMLLEDGEVAAVCQSSRMAVAAFEVARQQGVGNIAFFQAGPQGLPSGFAGAFDLVFSLRALWLAPSKPALLGEIFAALRPGGTVTLADLAPPGRAFDRMAQENPPDDAVWSPLESGRELLAQMHADGFSQGYWEELLPGIGLILGRK